MQHSFFSEGRLNKHLLPFVGFCYLVIISILHGSICQVEGRSSATDDAVVALDEKLQSKKTPRVTIFRVPLSVRKANDDAYTPRLVSIGPYHHGKEELKTMDELKNMFLKDFLKRSDKTKSSYLRFVIIPRVEELRGSYFEPIINMNDAELAEMILEDAAFILELFYRIVMSKNDFHGDLFLLARFPNVKHARAVIMDDLLKLENQLPAFILKDLLDFANFKPPSSAIKLNKKDFIHANETISLAKLTYSFFWFNRVLRASLSAIEVDINSLTFDHFVDFVRRFHLPRNGEIESSDHIDINTIKVNEVPSVAELKEIGVKFEINKSTSSIYDVNFDRGVFSMPTFFLVGSTEILFRNVIIFEVFRYPGRQYLAQFMKFLNFLVKEPRDVDILDKSGILQNWMNNNDVAAALINDIGADTVIYSENTYYATTLQKLIDYSDNPWHGFIELLKKDYFNTPWAAIAFVAAFVALVCAILQTTFAIIQTKRQGPSPKRLDADDHGALLTTFMGLQPPKFLGTTDSVEAKNWITYIEKIMDSLQCNPQQKVSLATFILYGEAEFWWQTCKHRMEMESSSIDWNRFKELFFEKYLPESLQDSREMKLIEHADIEAHEELNITVQSSSPSVHHQPQIMSTSYSPRMKRKWQSARRCYMHYKRKAIQVGACIPFVMKRNIIRNVLARTSHGRGTQKSPKREDPTTAVASTSTTNVAMSESSKETDVMMGQKFF